jgi:hypothetical protein
MRSSRSARSSRSRPLRIQLADYLERIRSDDPACVEVELACPGGNKEDGLNDEHVKELAGALRSNRHTRSLNVWGNDGITDVGAEALLDLLIDNSVLERINLDITSVSEANRHRVQAELLQRCFATVSADNPDHKYAHTLDLSRRDLRDYDIEQAAVVLRGNPFVTSLALWGNPRVSDRGLTHILDLLQTKASLSSVSLEGTAASAEMQRDIAARINQSRCHKALSQAVDPRVSLVNLADSSLTDAGLSELARLLPGNMTLATLLLTGNPHITGGCLDKLLTALDEVPFLTSLAVDTKAFNGERGARVRRWKIERITKCILTNAETCTKVDFTTCPLRDSEWPAVLEALRANSTVVSLNLGASKLSVSSVQGLLEVIQGHQSSRVN